MTVLLTLYSWLIGKLELIPLTPVLAFVSFFIGFINDPNFSSFGPFDYVSYSLLGTGIFTLALNQASASGILYKYADETEYVDVGITNGTMVTVFQLDSDAARETYLNYAYMDNYLSDFLLDCCQRFGNNY